MNILLINHYAGSVAHGMEFRPFYLAREWVRAGHSVSIVAASFAHPRSRQPQLTAPYTEETIEGIHYFWLKTPAYTGNGLARIRNIFTFLWRLYSYKKRLLTTTAPDVVISSSTYPLDIFPAKMLARTRKVPLIYEVHDLWPLSVIELGGISKYHPFIILLQYAENTAYKNADTVVSILPYTKEHMLHHGMHPAKFNHIPNGICKDDYMNPPTVSEEHMRVIEKLRTQGKTIVCYAGNHGVANNLHIFIDAAEQCIGTNLAFICVGDGSEKEQLQHYAASKQLPDFYFLPSLPKRQVLQYLTQMDILYIGLQPKPLFRFGVSPNKLFDYMMAKKPIVYAIDAANNPVEEAHCGYSAPPNDAHAIATTLLRLAQFSPEEREAMGNNGFSYVIERHEYSVLAESFIRVIHAACREHSNTR